MVLTSYVVKRSKNLLLKYCSTASVLAIKTTHLDLLPTMTLHTHPGTLELYLPTNTSVTHPVNTQNSSIGKEFLSLRQTKVHHSVSRHGILATPLNSYITTHPQLHAQQKSYTQQNHQYPKKYDFAHVCRPTKSNRG